MEDVLEQRAEKCTAYDKKLFIKGRQSSHHDAVACIANLVVFLDFIRDNEGTSESSSDYLHVQVNWKDLSFTSLPKLCCRGSSSDTTANIINTYYLIG